VWTAHTFLARQIRTLERQEQADGVRRVFRVPWPEVAAEVPAYGRYVEREMARLGREHPLIRTQYDLQEVDEQAGLFPAERRQQMRGDHPRLAGPRPGARYVLTLDVGGESFAADDVAAATLPGGDGATRSTHDHTALTVFELDHSVAGELRGPVYRVVDRRAWVAIPHTLLYAAVLDLTRTVWNAQRLVVDATGLGAGLVSFLRRALGEERIVPVVFTATRKSELGWAFLALCDTGRFKDHVPDGSAEQALFWRQVEAAEGEILPGPGQRLRWEVRDRTLHDDLLLSAALVAALEADTPSAYAASAVIDAGDVLDTIDGGAF